MLTRHKIPTVFSIYMMDVLCCALGCIVLLWQVSFQEAESKTAAALNSNQVAVSLSGELESLKTKLEDSYKKYLQLSVELDQKQLALDKTRKERDEFVQLALVRKQEFDELRKNHLATESLLAKLKIEHKELQSKSNLTAAQLAEKLKAHAELLDKIARTEARVVLLEKDVDAKKLELLLANKKSDDKSVKLKEADAQLLSLQKQLIDLRGVGQDALNRLKIADLRVKLLEQDADRSKTDLADANRRLKLLMTEQDVFSRRLTIGAKDLADARAQVASLEGEKLSLINKAKNIQSALENRFAGITLTGKKVIFLVDMSGSMELTEENTIDPDKWPLVCETVGRLLQSLTDLRRFQVILFSDRFLYPLNHDRQWIEYDGPATAKATVAALRAIKPKGGTDMYAPFAEAFRFRDTGLDTVYLLSDGLPNLGEGMPSNSAKLSEQQVTEVLAKTVRQRLKLDWNRYVAGQPRVRINTIGFFYESPDVGAFLWALAREHDGSFVGMSK